MSTLTSQGIPPVPGAGTEVDGVSLVFAAENPENDKEVRTLRVERGLEILDQDEVFMSEPSRTVIDGARLRMAHAGMPGFGARTLRAFICNSVAISPRAGVGVAQLRALGDVACIGERFAAERFAALSEAQVAGRGSFPT